MCRQRVSKIVKQTSYRRYAVSWRTEERKDEKRGTQERDVYFQTQKSDLTAFSDEEIDFVGREADPSRSLFEMSPSRIMYSETNKYHLPRDNIRYNKKNAICLEIILCRR